MAKFEIAFNRTEKLEGCNIWTNISGDKGGETWSGISRKMNPKWEGWVLIDEYKKVNKIKSGSKFTTDKLEELKYVFYKLNYWDPMRGDELKSQIIANDLYDTNVNCGVGTSMKLAHRQYGLTESTKMTNVLFNKLNSI